ncbi:hypothetical protein GCM10029992_56530 [Glycomyces albus]
MDLPPPDRPRIPQLGQRPARMLTWIRFADKKTGAEFCAIDNHLDHRSDRARRKARRSTPRSPSAWAPVVIAGDFNCAPGSRPYTTLTDAGLDDAWEAAEKRLTPAWGTFNNWKTAPVEEEADRLDPGATRDRSPGGRGQHPRRRGPDALGPLARPGPAPPQLASNSRTSRTAARPARFAPIVLADGP